MVNGINDVPFKYSMPRRSRIMLPGVPVHVIQRGNNRQRCFYEEEDRSFYLFQLSRLLPKAGCTLHAYCLMTNHVHLLLTAKSVDGCAALMKGIGQLHTQYMNRTHGRTGSLWEGRFRSCLVQTEDYLLSCYAYVDMNPVRANMVAHPAEYSWSSYQVNATGSAGALITAHDEYLRLGSTSKQRGQRYGELIETLDAARIAEIRAATNGNFALGDASFRQQVSAASGRRAERGLPGRPRLAEKERNQVDLFSTAK